MEKELPRGVKIIGVIHKWLFGVMGFLIGVLALIFVLSPSPQFAEKVIQSGRTIAQDRIGWIWSIFLSIASFILGNGLLSLKSWGRKGLIYLSVLIPILSANKVIRLTIYPELRFILSAIFGLAISIVVIYYLTRPKVKALFRYKGFDEIFWF